jgi:hypothetical protein
MTPLDLPGLILIAMQTLGLDTAGALAELDVPAAEAALAEAAAARAEAAGGAPATRPATASPQAPDDPGIPATGRDPAEAAEAAAALLCALLRHRPFRHGNVPVAVAAATTFLALGGWQADLDPPAAAREVVTAVAGGRLPLAALAAWLAPRLSPGPPAARAAASTGGPNAARRGAAHPDPPAADDRRRAKEGIMQGWLPGRSRSGRKKGMFRRFSPGARESIIGSQREARSLRHGYIGTEHILLGLLHEGHGAAAQALQAAGITEEAARQRIVEIVGRGAQEPSGHIPFTARAKKVLELALREAAYLNHLYIGSGHILLGLLREGDGLACQLLADLGADSAQLREQVMTLIAAPATEGAGLAARVVPPHLRDIDLKVTQARQEKDEAIDARDFPRAAALRDRERELLAERDRRLMQWRAGTDPEALGLEIDRLREEVRRLQDLLLQHGIDAGEPGQRSA